MKFTFNSHKPSTTEMADWHNWSWQMRNSYANKSDLDLVISLTRDEINAFEEQKNIFKFRVTPYYLSLIDKNDIYDPIRKIAIPQKNEMLSSQGAHFDPLAERSHNPVPRIIHRYSDRVLFLVTDFCSVYCRYCTRKHFTGQDQVFPKEPEYEKAIEYIKNHSGISEVILSGGDPLTLSDPILEKVLKDLRSIEHVEIIRIGSRMPVVNPMRVTPDLVKILKAYGPIYFMNHFNHPRELTSEAKSAIDLLVDHGIVCFNQTVLLNGVNNHPAILQALSRRLVYLRVKPYYLFQCDPSLGTEHLRTPVAEGEQIIKQMWGHLSGLAMPTFSLDIPAGGGKTTLVPNFEISREPGLRDYKGWDGVTSQYIDPIDYRYQEPSDLNLYISDWEKLQNSKN